MKRHLVCGFLNPECQEAGGRANFQHTFPGEIVSTEVFIETFTLIPLSFNKPESRDICAVVKVAFFD